MRNGEGGGLSQVSAAVALSLISYAMGRPLACRGRTGEGWSCRLCEHCWILSILSTGTKRGDSRECAMLLSDVRRVEICGFCGVEWSWGG